MASRWTASEDDQLRELIKTFGRQWSVIASHIPSRTAAQVSARWEKCINPDLTKGAFTPEEDAILADFVNTHGVRAWPKTVEVLPHRSPKQCRERWFNNLDPSVTKLAWTPEEDALIFELYLKYGPKWSTIAPLIAGRTDNAIKNRWNASISHRFQYDETGKPFLAPSAARKYTRRKQLDGHRPPALSLPPAIPFVESNSPMILSMTPMTFGVATPAFSEELCGSEFGASGSSFDSPFPRQGINFMSPLGLGHDFLL
jgi:hypothetical protein